MCSKKIKLEEIPQIISKEFKGAGEINCYAGSNAATPTAILEAITKGVEDKRRKLPFIRMIHLLTQGPLPYLKEGLQDRIRCYSVFSGKEVRQAINEGRAYYLPCTLVNLDSLISRGEKYQPDLAVIKVSKNPYTGEYSLGLSVEALHTAIDYAKVVVAELDHTMPFVYGSAIIDEDSIDYIIEEGIYPVYAFKAPDFNNLPPAERRIGELITEHFIVNGATLQVGIGAIPDAVVGVIKQSNLRNLGVQTELYGDGLMELQKAGIVNNRMKKVNKGYSTTSLIMGSRELYDYVHMRAGIQMRPCSFTNAAQTIRQNPPFISINTAMGSDLGSRVWADSINSKYHYSGNGGQTDFIRAVNNKNIGVAIIAFKSMTDKGISKIVTECPAGVNLTATAYDNLVIVTEYGIADLRGLSISGKALALAAVAHPEARDILYRYIQANPTLTKPRVSSRCPDGVILYKGDIKL